MFPLGGWSVAVVSGFAVTPAFAAAGVGLWLAGLRWVFGPIARYTQAFAIIGLVMMPVLLSGLGVLLPHGDPGQYSRTAVLALFFASLPLAMAVLTGRSIQTLETVARLHLGVGLFVALYGIYQVAARLLDLPLASLPLNNPVSGEMRTTVFFGYPRPSSVFTEPSWFGAYLVDLSTLSVIVSAGLGSRAPLLFRVGRILFPVMVVITLSVGAYLNLFLVMLALAVSQWTRTRAMMRVVFTIGVVSIGVWAANETVTRRLEVDVLEIAGRRLVPLVGALAGGEGVFVSGESAGTRLESMELAVRFFLQSPAFGIGVGNFAAANEAIGKDRLYVDSAWLAVLAEQGAVGVLCWVGLFAILLRRRSLPDWHRPYYDGYRGVVLARAVGMVNLGGLWDFWIFLPLGLLTVAALAHEPPAAGVRA